MDYHTLVAQESHGSYGLFGIKIEVAGTKLPDLTHTTIWDATYEAAKAIEAAIMKLAIANDPDAKACAEKEKSELTSLFPEPIFIEEIPNGYCHSYCCMHLPWFVITTKIGKIQIGWRKRVINIDWSLTSNAKNSTELFPEEDVTKGAYYIHAWSIEKAKEYVTRILNQGVGSHV